jgi:glycerol-3-phosphate dehydrogenase (NAD(P)+)
MKITILGCGRWGSFLAYYLHGINHEVLLWGRHSSEKMKKLSIDRTNDYLTLPENIILSTSLKEALNFSKFIIIAIIPDDIQSLLDLISEENYQDKTFIIAMKGFDKNGERISTVLTKNFSDKIKIVSFTGAGQPQDLIENKPTCMVVDSNDNKAKKEVAKIFNSELISVSLGNDLIGSEIGSAAKNVLGIASGILAELGSSPLIGSLVVFGLNEISKLVSKSGGEKDTAYGLSCLGDIETTFFSLHSRSRSAGISIVKNIETKIFIPGFYTSETILKMAENYKITMPLFTTIKQIIKKELEPNALIKCITQYNKSQINFSTRITNVFYCRAMDGFHYEEIKQIYNDLNKKLKENNLILLNSKPHFLQQSIVNKKNSVIIVDSNEEFLEKADCVIVDLSIKNHFYVGCIDEMVCAYKRNIFVIVISGDSGAEERFYINRRANKIVKNFDGAIEYISLINKEVTKYE